MSFSSSSWQSTPTQANKLRTSYLKGFLDISGSDAAGLRVRNNNAIELFDSADAPKFQMNATEYIVPDAGNAAVSITVPIEKLSYLYGLNTNIQGKFDAISNGESVSNNLATVNANVSGNLEIGNQLIVGGEAEFRRNVNIGGNLHVGGNVVIDGNEYVNKSLFVKGDATIDGRLYVLGDVSMSDDLYVKKKLHVVQDSVFDNNLLVTGKLTVTELIIGNNVDDASASGFQINQKITATAGLDLTGTADLHNALNVDGKITGSAALELTGAATMHSTLGVDGKITGSDALEVAKAATFSDVMSVAKKATFSDKMSVAMDASFGADLQIANKLRVGNDSASVYINGPNYIGSAFANSISVKAGDLDIAPGSANNSVHIRGGLYVDGSVNFLGDFIKTDTKVQVTDQIEVSNSGTGPALKITQTGANPVASFSDSNGIAFLMDDAGKMGVGAVGGSWNVVSNKPTAELDVHGAAKISTTLDVTGAASFADTLAVTGTSTFTGVATFQNGIVLGQTFVDQW